MGDSVAMNEIAKIPGIRFQGDSWLCSANQRTVDLLRKLNFELSRSLLEWSPEMDVIPTKLKIEAQKGLTLYPYQQQGVHFIESRNGRALVADEMGLGKTVQALMWCELHPSERPVLVICPSMLKINWQREIEKWISGKVKIEILKGTSVYTIPRSSTFVIVNYDILDNWLSELQKFNFQVCILDEAHYIKNNGAKRTKAFKRLNKKIPKLIALTGTPIDNRPSEIYNVVQAVDPMVFPNYIHFITKYCGAKKTYFGWDTSGSTNMQELHTILKRTIMIRRKKSEVLKELPEKQFVSIPIQIDNEGEYRKAEGQFVEFLQKRYSDIDSDIEQELKQFAKRNDYGTGEVLTDSEIKFLKDRKIEKASLAPFLVQIEYLKQLAVEGKFKFIKEWIEDFLDSNEKLVVFGVHKKFIEKLCTIFPNTLRIDGGTSMTDRQKAVDEFQGNPKRNLLIANIRAAGVGITLTAASNVMIFEFPWSPSILSQAIDRLHRIGQLHQVTAWSLVGENTIEERILKLLKEKENLISQVLDGVDAKDTNIVRELVKTYRK